MDLSQSLITGKGVTLLEALSVGGLTTFIGLGIVFGVLVILMVVLYLFKTIFYKEKSEKVPEVTNTVEIAPVEEDEEELIAILTAAVAASLNTSTYNLHIKSYRRIKDTRPAWNKEGLRETIGSRF